MIFANLPWVDNLNNWLAKVGDFALNPLLPALVILVCGLILIHFLTKLSMKLLNHSKMEKAAHTLINTVIRVVLYVLLALVVLSTLGIDVTSVLALFSVLTLAVSLSVQNALTNIISGFTLIYTDPFSAGDFVEVGGQSGTVEEIGLTYTKLATADGKRIYIPNGAVTSAEIVNYTVMGKRRADVSVSASYDCPVEAVLEALKEAGNIPGILEENGVSANVDSYGDSSINYVVRVWANSSDYWTVLCELKKNIKKVFDEKGIDMNYPHLNVHLDK